MTDLRLSRILELLALFQKLHTQPIRVILYPEITVEVMIYGKKVPKLFRAADDFVAWLVLNTEGVPQGG